MHFSQIEDILIRILHDAHGKFLFPYQIFMRIREIDPFLASRIETAYPTEPGSPIMSEGTEIHFSPSSFIAHALNTLEKDHGQIRQEWLDTTDIEIEGILPGNEEATSMWAWQE